MDITIRNAYESEANQLSKIALEAKKFWNYPDTWFELWGNSLTITPKFIRKNNVLVATKNTDILGFIALSINNAIAEIEHMWILPRYIKEGIGRLLLNEIIKYCRLKAIKIIRIESDPNAKGFYEKMGAKQIGYVDSLPKPRKLPVLEITI